MSNDNWTTPSWLFRYLYSRFDFKLDAAATAENALCKKFYDEDSDGLASPWAKEGWTFCNPPYSNVGPWVQWAAEQWLVFGVKSVNIVPVRADQGWWHDYVVSNIGATETYLGRISFGGSKGTAWMYNINLIFGARPHEIIKSIDVSVLDPNKRKKKRKGAK
jgi:site-specific DNA-methyltransferase (adenine-specific)